MKTHVLSHTLRQSLRDANSAVRPDALEHTRLLVKAEIKRRRVDPRLSFASFVIAQARFIGWRIVLVQAVAFALPCLFLSSSLGALYWAYPRYPAMLLCCVSSLVWLSVPLLVSRAHRHRMAEIEAATRFSRARLIAAQLVLTGMGGALLLGGVLLLVLLSTPMPLSSAMLYLLLPSLLACSICLYLLLHIPAERLGISGVGSCVLSMLTLLLLSKFAPALYQQALSPALMGVCAALALLCAHQLRNLLTRAALLEMQCA